MEASPTEERPLLYVVKYRWANKHGVWFDGEWAIVLDTDTEEQIVSRCCMGKGSGVQGVEIVDRAPIPEQLRRTGRAGVLKSYVVLYDKNPPASELTAEQFVARMCART